MAEEIIIKIIQLYGFPAAMCIWFMWRLEKRLDILETTNHRQVVIMAVLVRILGDRKTGTYSEEYDLSGLFDAITGVDEIPLPPAGTKSLERKTQ